jgi:signal transduction histidine kinase
VARGTASVPESTPRSRARPEVAPARSVPAAPDLAPAPRLDSLRRLRLRLTAWYVATFAVILVLLGAGLFVAVRHQISRQLDDALRAATAELVRAARIRQVEADSARGAVVDAVDELRIPDRTLYLLDTSGRAVRPAGAPTWVVTASRRAGAVGTEDVEQELPSDRTVRLHAERFTLPGGRPLVAVAVADRVELEDRYAALIAAFGAAAAVAVVLVAGGGWLLAQKSTEPVERTLAHMRRFMADAAHELRTPLAVLRGRAEIALQQPRAPAAYVAALQGSEGESRRLGRIVEDLLTLARVDAGERPVERARVYLDDVTVDAAGAAGALAAGRGVTLTMTEYEEAVVHGDAALLRQLVMILLDNAVKFTPAGGEVRVRVGAPAGRATLVVEDTGVGIGAHQLPHVFERFWRGDPARTRGADVDASPGGAGLGLAIARWIADAHGAAIDLASEPGQGTRVAVAFPAPEGVTA